MALANYSDLQAKLAEVVARDDASTHVVDAITLAEGRFNRNLRQREMMTNSALSLSSSSFLTDQATLPTDYLEWIRASWFGSSRVMELKYAEPDSERWNRNFRPGGDPQLFTIVGSLIRVRPSPSSTTSFTLEYYQKIPALSGSNATNWLLTADPDLYYYASLAEMYLWARDQKGFDWCMRALGPEMAAKLFNTGDAKVARRQAHQAESAERAETKAGL